MSALEFLDLLWKKRLLTDKVVSQLRQQIEQSSKTVSAEFVADLLAAGERLFVLDMTQCPYLDSAGLGETVAIVERIEQRQGRVVLVLTGKTRSLFEVTRLTQVFEHYVDEQEALASFIPTRASADDSGFGAQPSNLLGSA